VRSPRTTSAAHRVVVVGYGMAGVRVVEDLLARDPLRRLDVTVLGEEPSSAYNRVLLSSVLAGGHDPAGIGLRSAASLRAAGVNVHTAARATRVDRERRTVQVGDPLEGHEVRYDTLVLATGSTPVVPSVHGIATERGLAPDVFVFRTLDDCDAIAAAARTASRAVVVGGGLLGLEAARGLAGRGLGVDVLHLGPHLMNAQLDGPAARVLTRRLAELGIRVRTGVSAAAVLTRRDRVTGVRLTDGTRLDTDMVVLACGVRPRVELARSAGLTVERGVVVDDTLASVDDPAVCAVGECAEHRGVVYGLVAPGWEQAQVLADRLTGARPEATYDGSRLVTRLKASGVDLAALGETHHEPDTAPEGTEVLQFSDPTRSTYKKVVVRDGKVVGAILLGDVTTVGTVTAAFDRGTTLPADRLHLLFAGLGTVVPQDPADLPDGALVCQCNAVDAGTLRACAGRGVRDVAGVARTTRATTGCGTCVATVRGVLAACPPPADSVVGATAPVTGSVAVHAAPALV
jgi:assimilatory nitrate reductase electron transfer subunit